LSAPALSTEQLSVLWLNDLDAGIGSILFSGVDTDKYTGDLIDLLIVTDSYANMKDRYLVTLQSQSKMTQAHDCRQTAT
jgi:hypothetical protein